MPGFNKRLDEASQRGHGFVRMEMEAEEAARRSKIAEETQREEASREAEGVARRFEKRMKDTLSAVAERLRATHTDGCGGEGFRRQALPFGRNEYFEMRASFGPHGVTLSVDACCQDYGVVHTATSGPTPAADFDEEKSQTWLEEQAAIALEKFIKKATVVRHPPTITTYMGKTRP
jgi:hypothetical protein